MTTDTSQKLKGIGFQIWYEVTDYITLIHNGRRDDLVYRGTSIPCKIQFSFDGYVISDSEQYMVGQSVTGLQVWAGWVHHVAVPM